MAVFTIPFETSSNYTYDSDRIEIIEGKALLKNMGLRAYWSMDTGFFGFPNDVFDDSQSELTGTTRNGVTPDASPKVGDYCALFDSISSQDIKIDNNPGFFLGNQPVTIAFWVNTVFPIGIMDQALFYAYGVATSGIYDVAILVEFGSGKVNFYLNNSMWSVDITSPLVVNDGIWHLVIASWDGTTMKLEVDRANTVSSAFNGPVTTANTYLGSIAGSGQFLEGKLDEVMVFSKDLTTYERDLIWNNGSGQHIDNYFTTSPTIYLTAGNSDNIASWNNFLVTSGALGGGAALNYQLSIDGIDWKYWNGAAWTTAVGAQYNTEPTVNTNIGSFSVAANKVYVRVFMVSSGFLPVEISEIQISYSVNVLPLVDAGTNKSTFDGLNIKPFSDCSFSDDGSVDKAYYKVDGEVGTWTEILQGGYGTLLEAVQDFDYTFNVSGVITVRLQVEDNLVATSEDSIIVTVNKYTKTINVLDADTGAHVSNIDFNPGDGNPNTIENSPFSYSWNYGTFSLVLSRDTYLTKTACEVISDSSDINLVMVKQSVLNKGTASIALINDELIIIAWLERSGGLVTSPTSCAVSVKNDAHTVVYSESSSSHTNGYFVFKSSFTPSSTNSYYLEITIISEGLTYVTPMSMNILASVDNIWNEPLSNHEVTGSMGEAINLIKGALVGKMVVDPVTRKLKLYKADKTTLLIEFDLITTNITMPAYTQRIPVL